jgi:hypothetical protein
MNTSKYPTGGRYFSSAFNLEKASPDFAYLYDSTAVWNADNGDLKTGAWRPITRNDLQSNITATGLQVIIGPNIAVTGVTNVNITNTVIPITGTVGINSSIVPISGVVSPISGSFGTSFTTVTAGQAQIPVGTKSWSINAISGNIWVDGSRLIASSVIDGGGYDGRSTLRTAINVGTTGGYAFVTWET